MLLNSISKKVAALALMVSAVVPAMAQDAAAKPEASTFSLDSLLSVDTLLISVAGFLLIPIYILSKTLIFAAKVYWEKTHPETSGTSGITKVLLPLMFLLAAPSAFAQDAAAAADTNPYAYTVWLILVVIGVEVFAILVLGLQTIKLLKLASNESEAASAAVAGATVAKKGMLAEIWEKLNQFKPLEQEADIDTGHSYDGIRELDNITPPWFTAGFLASIFFAIVYLWVYHVSDTGPRQEDEFAAEMAQAEEQKKAFLATQANNVDENSVTLLTSADDIAAGKKHFETSCVACHLADLGGQVGPNLVDAYWIHGGSVKDVFKVIKYGVQDKGMMPWKDEYTPQQIAQLTSYILSMQGSKPKVAKEPQGELYTPAAEAPAPEAAPQQVGI
jgi:cytochrome c oxidase cbb3-type subunit III